MPELMEPPMPTGPVSMEDEADLSVGTRRIVQVRRVEDLENGNWILISGLGEVMLNRDPFFRLPGADGTCQVVLQGMFMDGCIWEDEWNQKELVYVSERNCSKGDTV